MLRELDAAEQVGYVEAPQRMGRDLDTSVPEIRAEVVHEPPQSGGLGLDGKGVVVGIIDSDFDFTLDDFRNPDGTTRIAYFWNQGLTPQGTESHPTDLGLNYGVEYDAAAINRALGETNPFALVRASDVQDEPEPGGHGTHVAGIATGNGRSADANFAAGQYVGVAPEATLILVQPDPDDVRVFGEWSSFTDSVRVAQAAYYIFSRASELDMPCVINMSLSQLGGSHDGQSNLERAIDLWSSLTEGRAFVSAAGNRHIFRGHASGTLSQGQTRTLRWQVGGGMPLPGGGVSFTGDDETPNEMEIWYKSTDRLTVKVVSPTGDETQVVSPGESDDKTVSGGDFVYISSERFTGLNGDARIYILVAPSAPGSPVQPGLWEVELEAVDSLDGRFDAWIERDSHAISGAQGLWSQSFFADPDFDHQMTLGTPATARMSIAVANYDHHNTPATINDSSSRGLTRDGREKPEVAAPGTDIWSSNGMGGRPNPDHDPADPASPSVLPVRVAFTGTSMSAPHVAGLVALMFQKNRSLTGAQVKGMIIASARRPAGVAVHDVAWGFGLVDAEKALSMVP
jgi:subtilisin family serine protease